MSYDEHLISVAGGDGWAMTEKEFNASMARAWSEGFKQGGPMHDEDYNHPDAHKINPYKAQP